MANKVDVGTCDPQLIEAARRGYKAYAANSDGKTFDGRPMPPWEKLTPAVQSHWCAATTEAARYASELMQSHDQRSEDQRRVYREDTPEQKAGSRTITRDEITPSRAVTPPSGVQTRKQQQIAQAAQEAQAKAATDAALGNDKPKT